MSTSHIAAMVFTMLVTLVLPIVLMLWFRRRGGKWRAFAIGAVTFFLFAMVFEQAVHAIVGSSPVGPVLRGNIWLTGLYGGLMAGLFEETGRLIAFRFLLRRQPQPATALAYGAGHGGCEAVLITGLTMFTNLFLSRMPPDRLPAEVAEAVQGLADIPATMFLWAGFERVVAVAIHVSLSVLVFAAVRSGKLRLFLLAVLLHAAVDFIAVTANAMLPVMATELLIAAVTAGIAVLAAGVYKKMQVSAENT